MASWEAACLQNRVISTAAAVRPVWFRSFSDRSSRRQARHRNDRRLSGCNY